MHRSLWILATVLISGPTFAGSKFGFEQSTRLDPSNYLLRSQTDNKDDIFETGKRIELGANLAIGSDCGRIDLTGTLKSTLQNLLNADYFGDLGKDIIGGSPMLVACYFSPTWCAILKHMQINANLLSQARLNQCSLIDKYTDSRVEDFYRERQSCVRGQIQKYGGDLEKALAHCQNVWDVDLANWAGGTGKATTNQLLESSAQWAGLTSGQARDTVDQLKSFIGDTTISRGTISVQYGPRGSLLTPRTRLIELQNDRYDSLCNGLLPKLNIEGQSLDQLLTEADVKKLTDESGNLLVDRQTLESLSYLPLRRRQIACRKLSDAMAVASFSKEVNRSIDVLTALEQNPNLPPNRQTELHNKSESFKQSVASTLALQKERNIPLNEVTAQINADGLQFKSQYTARRLSQDTATQQTEQTQNLLFDCADGVMCPGM